MEHMRGQAVCGQLADRLEHLWGVTLKRMAAMVRRAWLKSQRNSQQAEAGSRPRNHCKASVDVAKNSLFQQCLQVPQGRMLSRQSPWQRCQLRRKVACWMMMTRRVRRFRRSHQSSPRPAGRQAGIRKQLAQSLRHWRPHDRRPRRRSQRRKTRSSPLLCLWTGLSQKGRRTWCDSVARSGEPWRKEEHADMMRKKKHSRLKRILCSLTQHKPRQLKAKERGAPSSPTRRPIKPGKGPQRQSLWRPQSLRRREDAPCRPKPYARRQEGLQNSSLPQAHRQRPEEPYSRCLCMAGRCRR